MNAIDYLISEHESHRDLLDKIDANNDLYQKFREELIHHVNMEEAVLYPNLLKVPDLEPLVREAWEEHNLCMQLVQELDDPKLEPKEWLAKFTTLKKLLLIHLDDEEAQLFPQIKARASELFLQEVYEQMIFQKTSMPTEDIIYPEEEGSHKLV
jgi:iron-sulfur cluster repair protein YtfE (RIC family)